MAERSFRDALLALVDRIQTDTQDKPRTEKIRHAFLLASHAEDNLHAAVSLAAAGIPVFPFTFTRNQGEEKKFPVWCPNGHQDATTDLKQILEWWGPWNPETQRGNPRLMVGMIVPPELVVVDVDMHGGENGLKAFKEARLAANAPEVQTFTTATPRNGRHMWFLRPAGLTAKAAPFPGVEVLTRWITDFSRRSDGRAYAIATDAPFDLLPAWLTPKKSAPAPHSPSLNSGVACSGYGPDPYLLSAITGDAETLARTGKGSRNQTLNDMTLRLFRMNAYAVQQSGPSADASDTIHAALQAACEENGLIEDDGATAFEKTYKSARDAAAELGPAPYTMTKGRTMAHDVAPADGIPLTEKAVTDTLKENGLQLRTLDIDDTEEPLPEEVQHPGGLLEDIMNFTRASSMRTRPIYALAGAIAILGTLAGQRVKTDTGLITNFYVAAIGPSADGKDAPCRAAARLLTTVTYGQAYGGNDVASAPAILALLAKEEEHRTCLVFPELGALLKATKLKGSPKAGIAPLLTELYSAYDKPIKKTYADHDRDIYVPWQSLSMIGTSVPSEFWPALQDGETINGFLGRLLVLEASGDLPPRNRHVTNDLPEALLNGLREVWAIDAGEHQAPVVEEDGKIDLNKTLPPVAKPHLIPYSDDARAMLETIEDECDARVNEANRKYDMAASSIWGRAVEHTMKLALLHAVSRARGAVITGQIERQDLAWAWSFAAFCSRRLATRLQTAIFSTQFEEWGNAIETAIQHYIKRDHSRSPHSTTKPGAPKVELQRALRGQPPRVVDEVIDKLVKMKRLYVIPNWKNSPASKRTMDLYCLVEDEGSTD